MTVYVWPEIDIDKSGLATEAKQDVIIGHIDGVESGIATIQSKQDSAKSVLDAIEVDTTALVGKDFATQTTLAALGILLTAQLDVALSTRATETTQQKLREWPYATFDKQQLTQGATTDTWEYLDGVAVVGTIVINYTDSTKVTISNIAYAPDKTV